MHGARSQDTNKLLAQMLDPEQLRALAQLGWGKSALHASSASRVGRRLETATRIFWFGDEARAVQASASFDLMARLAAVSWLWPRRA